MLDFIKKVFQFRIALPIVLLLIGGVSFIWCTCFPFHTEYPIAFCLCSKLGDILLISALLSFLTSSVEYLGVFKNELLDIVYDVKFLKRRNDIEDVWSNVSKVLFKSKFPLISQDLLKTIKKNYLPENEVSYYGDYKHIYDIKFDEIDREYLHVKNDVHFILNAADQSEFKFPMKNWICTDEDNKDKVEFKIMSVEVNGDEVTPKFVSTEYKDGQVCFHYEIVLKGCTEYKIKQSLHKKYSIQRDNYIGFKAKWLVNNMTVQLFYPKELDVLFVERATANRFNLVKRKDEYLEYEYKGLILRSQGFIMILNPKNKSYEQQDSL